MTWEPMVVWYLTAPTWNICLNTDPCQSGAKFKWSWLDCKLRKLWANTSYRHIWLIVFFYFVLVVVSRKSHDVINHIFIVKIAKWRSANWSWQLGKNFFGEMLLLKQKLIPDEKDEKQNACTSTNGHPRSCVQTGCALLVFLGMILQVLRLVIQICKIVVR